MKRMTNYKDGDNMRDPKRIARIIKKFEKVWKANPEIRFGQLYDNIANYKDIDGYYLEDNLLEKYLDKLIRLRGTLETLAIEKDNLPNFIIDRKCFINEVGYEGMICTLSFECKDCPYYNEIRK